MIKLTVNGKEIIYRGLPERSLLDFLRNDLRLTAAKDGCSGEGICGACTVLVNDRPLLACQIKMEKLNDANVITLEGIDVTKKMILAISFLKNGAVQCGFCTPGIMVRAYDFLNKHTDIDLKKVKNTLKPHICRCTGYKKIEKAILEACYHWQDNKLVELDYNPQIGKSFPKYEALYAALGEKKFVDDLFFDGMVYGALKFSDYPRAVIKKIDISKAKNHTGVLEVITAKDVPGNRYVGLIRKDWPVLIDIGETTHYIGDVLAIVVAKDKHIATEATQLIDVEYEVLEPIVDVFEAMKDVDKVHSNYSNIAEVTQYERGNVSEAFEKSDFVYSARFQTQRIEHAFMEVESCLALWENDTLKVYSQTQGVYEDQRQIASLLGIDIEKVNVILMPSGGGFGGKEDLSIQGHTALAAFLLKKPVKISLTRQQSIRMHPKRHPVVIDLKIAANKNGKLTAVEVKAYGDTGAYLSVGNKVMERVAGHATGAYYVPNVKVSSYTVYTNNIPSGAMRGFGVPQITFAIEAAIDQICYKAGFDRWKFRYENILDDGLRTATGQKLKNVGLKQCLLAVKNAFYSHKYVGLAAGIKNSGVGNGMIDASDAIIEIVSANKIVIKHGWTEMGQGVNTVALQAFCSLTNVNPALVEVVVDTSARIPTGMTTSSRATALLTNAIIEASKPFIEDLKKYSLKELVGRVYKGTFVFDKSTKPGANVSEPITHFTYGYAAQLVILDEYGKISKIIAAHDAGRVINKTLFEGQIEGAIHMGLGYALSENLPMSNGFLLSDKMKDLKILRSTQMPDVEVIAIEVPDDIGGFGSKGVGEIGMVPTAAAVANALTAFDGKPRYSLPLGESCL